MANNDIRVTLPEQSNLSATVYDINYIPDYIKAEQERRANETIRIANEQERQQNELGRIALAEDLQTKLENDYWRGEKGDTGATPDISATASISGGVGTPSVTVTRSGTDEEPTLAFAFSNLKGDKGDTGEPEPIVYLKSFYVSQENVTVTITDQDTIAGLQEIYDATDFENLELHKKIIIHNPYTMSNRKGNNLELPTHVGILETTTEKKVIIIFEYYEQGVVYNEAIYTVNYKKSTGQFEYTETLYSGAAEAIWNKVTSISSSSTDTQYPSAKCVYDLVGNINDVLDAINNEVI